MDSHSVFIDQWLCVSPSVVSSKLYLLVDLWPLQGRLLADHLNTQNFMACSPTWCFVVHRRFIGSEGHCTCYYTHPLTHFQKLQSPSPWKTITHLGCRKWFWVSCFRFRFPVSGLVEAIENETLRVVRVLTVGATRATFPHVVNLEVTRNSREPESELTSLCT